MKNLDPDAVKTAKAAADDWAEIQRGAFRIAMTPSAAAATVDNPTE